MRQKRITIKDIAKLSGVSDSTVSRVLNNQAGVNEKTKCKILEVIRKEGYRPDSIARCLVTGKSDTLAFITEDIRNPFFAELARGVEDVASANGYHVIYYSTDGSVQKENMFVELLIRYRISGVIFTSFSGRKETIELLHQQGIAVVLANRYFRDIPLDCVVVDNVGGAFVATEHLIQMGHTRIAHVGGRFTSSTSIERKYGYEKALRASGLPVDTSLIVDSDLKFMTGCEITRKLLMNSDITAIFAGNDLMALGAWQACLEMSKRVPNDIAIVGFDDIEFASFPNISLTTIWQPKYEMGRFAAELLLKRLSSFDEANYECRVLKTKLIIRKSSGRVNE